jgi:hypothetical protein
MIIMGSAPSTNWWRISSIHRAISWDIMGMQRISWESLWFCLNSPEDVHSKLDVWTSIAMVFGRSLRVETMLQLWWCKGCKRKIPIVRFSCGKKMEDIIGDVGRILLEYLAIDIGISWQFSQPPNRCRKVTPEPKIAASWVQPVYKYDE